MKKWTGNYPYQVWLWLSFHVQGYWIEEHYYYYRIYWRGWWTPFCWKHARWSGW
jgi:hypothetical protein